MQLSFRILGPLAAELTGEAEGAGENGGKAVEIDTGPFKQRLLLALLLCRCNSVVLVDQIIDALWWDGPPRTAHKNVQVYVSHLRKLLLADGRPDRLRYRPPGYQLVLPPDELDALCFENLAREGRLALRRGDARAAAAATRGALRLWRDAVLADLVISPVLREEADRLQDRRLSVYEDWFEAELQLGNHAEVLEEIERVVRSHPLRERLRSHQLTALYRGGRQTEALAEYDNLRQRLAAELGLDPSPALQRLYRDMLSGRPTLAGPVNVPPPRAVVSHAEVAAHAAHSTANGPLARVADLPRVPDDFSGRAAELGALLSCFGHGAPGQAHLRKLAAIIGPPGSGTTTLALRAAHMLGPRFRDGVILLPLRDARGAPRTTQEIQDDLLGRIEAFPRAASEASDRGARLRGRLADLQLLLILDGAAGEAQARAVLPGAGSSSVILTSFRYLGGIGGLARFQVGPFSEAEALELLRAIIGADRVGQEPAAAARIVRACGLLPLAVRAAGARLAELAHLSLERFAARLEERERLLDELTVGDLSVRGRFEHFVAGLDAAERLALIQVAAAWGPLADGPGQMEQLLERLAGVHALSITCRDLRPAGYPVPFDMPWPLWVFARQLMLTTTRDGRA